MACISGNDQVATDMSQGHRAHVSQGVYLGLARVTISSWENEIRVYVVVASKIHIGSYALPSTVGKVRVILMMGLGFETVFML